MPNQFNNTINQPVKKYSFTLVSSLSNDSFFSNNDLPHVLSNRLARLTIRIQRKSLITNHLLVFPTRVASAIVGKRLGLQRVSSQIKNNQFIINRESSISTMNNQNLSKDETARYSRQMLCPEIGKKGQLLLKSRSVLIVGAGGLGCPTSLYLTAAGIGRLGIVDSDVVETSNLHRQVLHSESTLGVPKVDSAIDRLQQLNSNVQFEKHQVRLSRNNALDIISKYDVIVDGTDNPMARYLLSDACVLLKKPLVSGSALRFEGQVTVYNFDLDTPCYRCVFPEPPPAGTVTNCADGGVLGVVPGIIGNLQAIEAIKIAADIPPAYAGILLLYDGLSGKFRNVQLRKRKDDCISCGKNPTITTDLMDYEKFCGVQCAKPVRILEQDERVTVQDYHEVLKSNQPHLLIDVRPQLQQDIIKLEHAVSIPLGVIVKSDGIEMVKDLIEDKFQGKNNSTQKIFVMCRRGIASQKAVRELKNKLSDEDNLEIKDIIGGLEKWSVDIDPTLPMY
ncbi:Molybdenum cofactor synthesis protein 3 [Blomia tropicalis]|nr:Molybdenum cofactor synthesis protein 3 [Blomia tropicalis]